MTPRSFVWAQIGETMAFSSYSRAGLLSVFTLSIRQRLKSVSGWPEIGSKDISARDGISHDKGPNGKTDNLGLVQEIPMRKE